MIRFAIDGMLSFSHVPEALIDDGAVRVALELRVHDLRRGDQMFFPERAIGGWASVFVAMLFLGGVQLICIGIIGDTWEGCTTRSSAVPCISRRRRSILTRRVADNQLLKFSAVGLLNTGLHYAVFLVLLRVGHLNYLLASALGYRTGRSTATC